MADGDGPSAEPQGAPGSGPGDNSTSASSGPPAGVAGFIDALNSMSSHLKARESMEADARREWSSRGSLAGGLLAAQALLDLFFLTVARSGYPHAWTDHLIVPLALMAIAAGTGALALTLFANMAARPLRTSPDSADRVALRHEDSPLRDRIRISQWILIDTIFTRFAVAERTVESRRASGCLAVSLSATVAVWLTAAPAYLDGRLASEPAAIGAVNSTALAVFAVLTLGSLFLADRRTVDARGLAQHYARQVLSFDRDFGGFLTRAERERVECAKNARRARGAAPQAGPEG